MTNPDAISSLRELLDLAAELGRKREALAGQGIKLDDSALVQAMHPGSNGRASPPSRPRPRLPGDPTWGDHIHQALSGSKWMSPREIAEIIAPKRPEMDVADIRAKVSNELRRLLEAEQKRHKNGGPAPRLRKRSHPKDRALRWRLLEESSQGGHQ